MLISDNTTAFDEYLQQNARLNQQVDKARIRKLQKQGASFDPL